MRRCNVGMEPNPTICDFILTKTPIQRLKEIRAKGGKIPQDLQLRLRALRLRKLRASTKAINRRREGQRMRRARSSQAWKAWEEMGERAHELSSGKITFLLLKELTWLTKSISQISKHADRFMSLTLFSVWGPFRLWQAHKLLGTMLLQNRFLNWFKYP